MSKHAYPVKRKAKPTKPRTRSIMGTLSAGSSGGSNRRPTVARTRRKPGRKVANPARTKRIVMKRNPPTGVKNFTQAIRKNRGRPLQTNLPKKAHAGTSVLAPKKRPKSGFGKRRK